MRPTTQEMIDALKTVSAYCFEMECCAYCPIKYDCAESLSGNSLCSFALKAGNTLKMVGK